MSVELAGFDAILLGAVAERELRKVALQVVIAIYGPVRRDNQKLLVLGPTHAPDGTLVPVNSAYGFASSAVYVDARL